MEYYDLLWYIYILGMKPDGVSHPPQPHWGQGVTGWFRVVLGSI